MSKKQWVYPVCGWGVVGGGVEDESSDGAGSDGVDDEEADAFMDEQEAVGVVC